MKPYPFFMLLSIFLTVSGCTNKRQVNTIDAQAFLSEYDISKQGSKDHALISFWKKGVIWPAYKKVILEQINLDINPSSGFNKVSHVEKAQLQEILELSIRESLKPMFKLVNTPGIDTLRLELAITDTETANALINGLQSMHPPINQVSALNSLLASTESFQGKSSIEGKITDSTTGDLLMVVADNTEEDNILDDYLILWGKVGKYYNYWSHLLGYQLCQHQKHNYCFKP